MVSRKIFQYKTTILFSLGAFVFLLALSGVIIWNAIELRRAVNNLTAAYLDDVSAEEAKSVDGKLFGMFKSLQIVADSIPRIEDSEMSRFLTKKSAVLDFVDMAVVGEDGLARFASGDSRRVKDFPPFAAALKGEFGAGTDGRRILYMVPIPDGGRGRRVLVGVKSKRDMQDLITGDFFDGQGSSTVINQKGEQIIPPLKKRHTPLIKETKYLATEDWAVKMQDDLKKNKPGRFILPTLSGRDIFVDYRPLAVNGWFIVMTVPTDIFTSHSDVFISRTFYSTLVMAAVFLLIMVLIISIQNRYRVAVENVSFYDPVTDGISNICFLMKTQEFINQGNGKNFAVVSMNIRNIGLINECEGRQQGDKLLRLAYGVFAAEMKAPGEMAARGNAGTFYLLMEKASKDGFLKRLRDITEKVAPLGGKMGPLRVDAGIFYPADESGAFKVAEAEVYADTARKSASRSYLNTFTFYDEELKRRRREEISMLNDIERAISEKTLSVYLQPKVSTQSGRIAGAEALVRWKHPKLGFVSPSVFIPLCEKNGIISRLDLLVFEEVCRILAEWKEAGMPLFPVSVNLSRQHIKDPSFFDRYKRISEKAGVDPGLIEFELTESIMLAGNDYQNARAVIDDIHRAGFTCSMDDFGSGYSSLGLLKDLKIDCLKLDRTFFINRFETPETSAVIESIISLARKLNIRTVAEGVEYKEQACFLRAIGCDLIQGFYYFRAVPVKEFERIALEDVKRQEKTPDDEGRP